MHKLGLVTFRIPGKPSGSKSFRKRRHDHIEEILSKAKNDEVSHLLFPGWTLAYTETEASAGLPKQDMKWLASRSKALNVIAEFSVAGRSNKSGEFTPMRDGLGVVAFEHGKQLDLSIQQQFAHASKVNALNGPYAQVENDVFAGKRIVTLDNLRILILVCGESNLLRNRQGDVSHVNRPELRHSRPGRNLRALQSLPYDVFFNPAHTQMWNGGKMHERYRAMSGRPLKKNRYTVHLANVRRGDAAGRSMFVFKNGMKDSVLSHLSAWTSTNPWELQTHEINP